MNKKWFVILIFCFLFCFFDCPIVRADWTRRYESKGMAGAVWVYGISEVYDVAIGSSALYVVGRIYSLPPTISKSWRLEKRDLANGALLDVATLANSWPWVYPSIVVRDVDPNKGLYIGGGVPGFTGEKIVEKRNLSTLAFEGLVSTGSTSYGYNEIVIDNAGNFLYAVGAIGNVMNKNGIDKLDLSTGVVKGLASGQYEQIAIDNTGIYVSEPQPKPPVGAGKIEKRDFNGNPVWSYNTEWPVADIAVDNTGVYVLQKKFGDWKLEKISLGGGAPLDSVKGNTGTTECTLGTRAAIAIDATGLYYGRGEKLPAPAGLNEHQWVIDKRDLNDLSNVLWSTSMDFGDDKYDDGAVVKHSDCVHSMAVDVAGLYVGGIIGGPRGALWGAADWGLAGIDVGGGGPVGPYIDIGLRGYDGADTVIFAGEPVGVLTSPLRISKGGVVYGIALVDPADAMASKFRIETNSGLKVIRKF
ncbi:MAG: hypothetical protein U9Q08_00560 [Candidatus Omnitrophota bacterium]|nr:hypothetical protein [Candidatus Omnitrophota bacterium]